MSLALQRAQVKAILSGISGVGAVHDYERYDANADGKEAFFRANFVRANKVNGWLIKADILQPEEETCSEILQRVRWRIRGWVSALDATASLKTAESLVETITRTFAAERTLNGTAHHSEKMIHDEILTGMVALGEAELLTHMITLTFISHEIVAVTYS